MPTCATHTVCCCRVAPRAAEAADDDDTADDDTVDDGDRGVGVSLSELLAKQPDTSITDKDGNTALHVMVSHMPAIGVLRLQVVAYLQLQPFVQEICPNPHSPL